ncbi:hypothetical protein, partial [Planktothrix tepida]|uniref:hypothetical protein n=1 Tax=Planktothrix tepida TaxID=1678309 RepID=UPI0011153492
MQTPPAFLQLFSLSTQKNPVVMAVKVQFPLGRITQGFLGVGGSPTEVEPPGSGTAIDLTIGNIEPIANPPTNVAVLIAFRRDIPAITFVAGCRKYSLI